MLFILNVAGLGESRARLLASIPTLAERATHVQGAGARLITRFLSIQTEITSRLASDQDYWIVVDHGPEVHPINIAPIRDLAHAVLGRPVVQIATVIFTEGKDLTEIWPAAWYTRNPDSDQLLLIHNAGAMDTPAVRSHLRIRLP